LATGSHVSDSERAADQSFKTKVRDVLSTTVLGRMVWNGLHKTKRGVRDMEARLLCLTGRRRLFAAPPPLFIGGTGGSGTRVLVQIAERAGVFMGDKLSDARDAPHLTVRYLEKWAPYAENRGALLSRYERAQMDYDLVAALIRHREGIPSPDVPWGTKVPRVIFFLSHVHRLFPSMKFLHLVRDGRDMAFSNDKFQLRALGNFYMKDLRARLADAPEPVRAIAPWSRVVGSGNSGRCFPEIVAALSRAFLAPSSSK